MNRDPILGIRTFPAGHDGYRVPLVFKVEGGLHYIKGNSSPYFTLTYTQHRKGFPEQCYSGGVGHEEILKYFPKFADLAALHLSDIDGAPMYAEANGWYWLEGAKRLRGRDRSPDECLTIFAKHCRVSPEEGARLCEEIQTREQWGVICEGMRARWKEEADACIAAHNLRVYGDAWEPQNA